MGVNKFGYFKENLQIALSISFSVKGHGYG
jgi:hypothetical protein